MGFRIGDFKTQIDPALVPEPGKRGRTDGRAPLQLRPVAITPRYVKHAEGSALIEVGDTRVVCTVSVEDRVPPFLKGAGEGWITSEYGMLPRSTSTRTQREARATRERFRHLQHAVPLGIEQVRTTPRAGAASDRSRSPRCRTPAPLRQDRS